MRAACTSCACFLLHLLLSVAGQNQVPPGIRKPPFVIVPPEGERLTGSASENIGVLTNPGPIGVVPQGHPPLLPQRDIISQGSSEEPALSPEVVKLIEQNLDKTCFACLCQASSNCERRGCEVTGPEQYFCGPYHISWAYWADSGKPGDGGHAQDFERCLKDFECAERAIHGYMTKYGRDCNGDGRIDCDDFARIHKAGPHNCDGKWVLGSDYWRQFDTCWRGNNQIDFRSVLPPGK